MVECSAMSLMSEENFRPEYEKLEAVGVLDADFDFTNEYVTSCEDTGTQIQGDILDGAELIEDEPEEIQDLRSAL